MSNEILPKTDDIDPDHQPKNAFDRVIYKFGNAASLFFLFTVVISFYEVLMRYVFNAPTIWVHESASFIGGVLFTIGGSYALATNRHVRVVLIYDAVSETTRRFLNIFHHLLGLLFTGLLSYSSWLMTRNSWLAPGGEIRLETSGSAWNPPIPASLKAVIFVVFCVMFIQFCIHLFQEVRGFWRKDDV